MESPGQSDTGVVSTPRIAGFVKCPFFVKVNAVCDEQPQGTESQCDGNYAGFAKAMFAS